MHNFWFLYFQFTDKLENMLDTLTSTEEQVTNAQPVSAHPDKIRDQMSDNNVSNQFNTNVSNMCSSLFIPNPCFKN